MAELTTVESHRRKSPDSTLRLFQQFVLFRAGSYQCAVPLANVDRALRMVAITPVPDLPAWLPGIINLHGEIVPVVDIGQRVGAPRREPCLEDRLLIVHSGEQLLALIVAEVNTVLTLTGHKIGVPVQLQADLKLFNTVLRWENQLILVVNVAGLLDQLPAPDELKRLVERVLVELQQPESPTRAQPMPSGDDLTQIRGIGPAYARRLQIGGIHNLQDLITRPVGVIIAIMGFQPSQSERVSAWQAQAVQKLEQIS